MPTISQYNAKGGKNLSNRQGTVFAKNVGGVTPVETKVKVDKGNAFQQAANFGTTIAKQVGSGGAFVGKKAAGFVVNTAKDIAQSAYLTAKTGAIDAPYQIAKSLAFNKQNKDLERKQQENIDAYKSGKISKDDYLRRTDDITKSFGSISKEAESFYSGPTPQERAQAQVETAVNVLTLGRLSLAQVGGKQALQAGSKEGIEALTKEASTSLEKAFLKVPATRALVERNLEYLGKREAQKLAGETTAQFLSREGKNVAVGLLIKRPIFYQTNIADAQKVYEGILTGNYDQALKSSAWLGVQMLRGGPIGAFFQGLGYAKGKLGQLTYGRQSYIDEISRQIGNGDSGQLAEYISKNPDSEKTFRILQESNLKTTNNNAKMAADQTLRHYAEHGYDLKNITPEMLYRDMNNWAEADELAQKALRAGEIRGVDPADASKYVVVRWDQTARQGIIDAALKAGNNIQDRLKAVQELANRPGVGWGNNAILMRKVEGAIASSMTPKEFEKAINSIDAATSKLSGMPPKLTNQLAKRGFTLAEPVGGRITPVINDIGETRKLVSGAAKNNQELFDPATAPHPSLGFFGGLIENAGLSPQSSSNIANQALAQHVVAQLDQLNVAKSLGFNRDGDNVNGGRAILSRLQQYVENQAPSTVGNIIVGGRAVSSAVTDIRQMTIKEVQDALKISKDEAKEVSKAIVKGYQAVPIDLRGMGDKFVDTLFSVNPLQKYYSRIQSAARYTYNPFFRVQESVETALLSRAESSDLMWNKSRAELDEGVRILENSRIFSSAQSGEAASDQVLGRISANLTQGQKRNLSGLAYDLAKKRYPDPNMSDVEKLQKLADDHSPDIDDALRIVVQYPRQGFLASPLARTLNVAFFPMRYNLKVTQIAGKVLAKQPPSVQAAFLHSMFNLSDWLKSDEGIVWQSKNSEAIQLLQWITPVSSISYTMKLLGVDAPSSTADGSDEFSAGQLGVLGGLPIGVFSQILDGQGIINLNKPYVNPKTGEVMPDYVPETTKARAATALADLINSMFTYPGRILGLPGKNAAIRGVVNDIISTEKDEIRKVDQTERLTPLQQQWIRVINGETSDEEIDKLYNSPRPDGFNWYTMPPLQIPVRRPQLEKPVVQRRTNLPTKASQKKAKGKKVKPVAQPIGS